MLPTENQKLLLVAVTAEKEPALEAFDRWKETLQWDNIDGGSFRLLGLLYRRLSGWKADDPIIHQLRGVYRNTWFRNQMLLHHGHALIKKFYERGIPVLLLKGPALVVQHYRDFGVRPMLDFDFCIPSTLLRQGMNLLESDGWIPIFELHSKLLPFRNSNNYSRKGIDIDLHWHVLLDACNDSLDEEFWKAGTPIEWDGIPVRVLSRSDQLIHSCIHGLRWNEVPSFYWMADALHLWKSGQAKFDWPRITRLCRTYHLEPPMADALDYLRAEFQMDVPSDVITPLKSDSKKIADYRRIYMTKPTLKTFFQRHYDHYCRHRFIEQGFLKYFHRHSISYWSWRRIVKRFMGAKAS